MAIKNKKRKIRNYSIIATSGLAGLGAAEGIFYGIPAVAKLIPGWAIAFAIVAITLAVMLCTFLLLAYLANVHDAEQRRRYKQALHDEEISKINKANGLECGSLVSETKDELKNQKKEIDSKIFERSEHEKAINLGKKF